MNITFPRRVGVIGLVLLVVVLAAPTTGGPGFDGVTDVVVTVRVTSDQPIVVGANFQFNGNLPSQCSLVPK